MTIPPAKLQKPLINFIIQFMVWKIRDGSMGLLQLAWINILRSLKHSMEFSFI